MKDLALFFFSQGPTGKPGLPGMPGADGPPVRMAFHHALRTFTVVTQHFFIVLFINNNMQIHWCFVPQLTANRSRRSV